MGILKTTTYNVDTSSQEAIVSKTGIETSERGFDFGLQNGSKNAATSDYTST